MSSPSSGRRAPAEAGARCPACGSRVRPEETWCSLCHTSLLVVGPGAELPPPVEPELGTATFVEHTPPIERPADPKVAAAADRLIAELAAAEAGRARESGLSSMTQRFGARSAALLIAGVGGLALLVFGLLALTVLGKLV